MHNPGDNLCSSSQQLRSSTNENCLSNCKHLRNVTNVGVSGQPGSSQSVVYFDESLFGADDSFENLNNSNEIDIDLSESTENVNDDHNDVDVLKNQGKCFSFFHWNVDGLYSKLFDDDFISFVTGYDFVCLVESIIITFNYEYIFPEHDVIFHPAVKLTDVGRPSGGVFCLVRKTLKPFVKEVIHDTVGHYLMFIIDKSLFGIEKDLLYVCAYVHPEGSG